METAWYIRDGHIGLWELNQGQRTKVLAAVENGQEGWTWIVWSVKTASGLPAHGTEESCNTAMYKANMELLKAKPR